jgi:hypothetical protein
VTGGPYRDELVPQELPYGTSAGAFGLRAASAGYARPAESAPMFPLPVGMPTMFGYAPGARTQSGASFDDSADFSEEVPTGEAEPVFSTRSGAGFPPAHSVDRAASLPQQVAPAGSANKPAIVKLDEPKPLPRRRRAQLDPLTQKKAERIVVAMLCVLLLIALLWHFFG